MMNDKTIQVCNGEEIVFMEGTIKPQYPNQEPMGVSVASEYNGQAIYENLSSVDRFKKIAEYMGDMYQKKNEDYGNAFEESVDELGAIAGLVPIRHKYVRLKNLLKGENKAVNYESVNDSLLDMANYCIMLYMAINK